MVGKEIEYLPSGFEENIRQVTVEQKRRNVWTARSAIEAIAFMYESFEAAQPISVLARVGVHPVNPKDGSVASVLHVVMIFDMARLGSHAGKESRVRAFEWNACQKYDEGKKATQIVFVDPTYIPESVRDERSRKYEERGFRKVYPVEDVTKEENYS